MQIEIYDKKTKQWRCLQVCKSMAEAKQAVLLAHKFVGYGLYRIRKVVA